MCFNSSYKIKYALSYIKSIYLLSKTKILIVCGTRDGQAIVLYTDDGDKAVNEEIENIKKYLKNIKKEDKQTPSVYNKTLELLSGVRYLIKDATYAYEKEYRLICK